MRPKEQRRVYSEQSSRDRARINGSGITGRGLRYVMKATRKVGAIRGKVGGGCGRKTSSCGQSQFTLIGEEASTISVKCL